MIRFFEGEERYSLIEAFQLKSTVGTVLMHCEMTHDGLGHQDFVRLCGLLDPGCEIHSIADGRKVTSLRAAEAANDGWSVMNANPHAQILGNSTLPLSI